MQRHNTHPLRRLHLYREPMGLVQSSELATLAVPERNEGRAGSKSFREAAGTLLSVGAGHNDTPLFCFMKQVRDCGFDVPVRFLRCCLRINAFRVDVKQWLSP